MKRSGISKIFDKYVDNISPHVVKDTLHTYLEDCEIRNSESIFTHQPVPPFGIYPYVVSRYAGPAMSRCVSFAFPWKYERNAHPTDDPAFSERAIFLRSAISALRDFLSFSFIGNLHTLSYGEVLSMSVDITDSSSPMIPDIS